MNTEAKKSQQERVARILCELMDDEWKLGRNLYMETAGEIFETLAFLDMLAALTAIRKEARKNKPDPDAIFNLADAALSDASSDTGA